MPDPPDLRISDQDRERVAAALSAHYAAGRLDDGELDERLNATYSARTESQLRTLLADMPALPAGELEKRAEFNARRTQLQRRMLQQSGCGVVPFAICMVIWLGSGADSFPWPLFVLVAVVAPLVRNGWALYGPAPDLDKVEADLDRAARHRSHHANRRARVAERRGARGWPPD